MKAAIFVVWSAPFGPGMERSPAPLQAALQAVDRRALPHLQPTFGGNR